MKKKILITGGAGFIGSAVIRHILSFTSHSVVNVDSLTYAGNLDSLEFDNKNNYVFENIDICKGDELKNSIFRNNPDWIMHLAAESNVDRSIDAPDQFIKTNIVGTYNLLETSKAYYESIDSERKKIFRLHHVSTDEVYGSLRPEEPAFIESHAYAPNSPYSATKAASDHLVRSYNKTYGLKVTTSNCSNNYGAFQFPEKLIPLCLINILQGKPLPIFGDGSQIRDWLHVTDHCRGIELIIAKGTIGQTYNIGGDNEWKNIDVVTLICNTMNDLFKASRNLKASFPQSPCARDEDAKSLITYVEDRLGHDIRYAIDATRIKSELNYSPAMTFERGMKDTVEWYLKNKAWWTSIKERSN